MRDGYDAYLVHRSRGHSLCRRPGRFGSSVYGSLVRRPMRLRRSSHHCHRGIVNVRPTACFRTTQNGPSAKRAAQASEALVRWLTEQASDEGGGFGPAPHQTKVAMNWGRPTSGDQTAPPLKRKSNRTCEARAGLGTRTSIRSDHCRTARRALEELGMDF
jgi:hypothetical protein